MPTHCLLQSTNAQTDTSCAQIAKLGLKNSAPLVDKSLGIFSVLLEKIDDFLSLPCRYQTEGCTEIQSYYTKLKQKKICKFRLYYCLYAGSECPVFGNINTLVIHLGNDHKVDMHDGCSFNHLYLNQTPMKLKNATSMLMVKKYVCFPSFCKIWVL